MLRPDVGTQTQFRKKKEPASYSNDPSLSPTPDRDGRSFGRERAEARIASHILTPCSAMPKFPAGGRWTIAVQGVDNRGNELMVITPLPEPEA